MDLAMDNAITFFHEILSIFLLVATRDYYNAIARLTIHLTHSQLMMKIM